MKLGKIYSLQPVWENHFLSYSHEDHEPLRIELRMHKVANKAELCNLKEKLKLNKIQFIIYKSIIVNKAYILSV